MNDFNKVVLLGRLTRDPETRYSPEGEPVTKLGLALNRKYHKGVARELTEEQTFVNVTGFGKNAETLSRYAKKGSPLLIDGHLRLNQWANDKGEKRSKLEVVVERFQLVGPKPLSVREPDRKEAYLVPDTLPEVQEDRAGRNSELPWEDEGARQLTLAEVDVERQKPDEVVGLLLQPRKKKPARQKTGR